MNKTMKKIIKRLFAGTSAVCLVTAALAAQAQSTEHTTTDAGVETTYTETLMASLSSLCKRQTGGDIKAYDACMFKATDAAIPHLLQRHYESGLSGEK